jgi:RNase P subunit RPR2
MFKRILKWLKDHEPVFCALCLTLKFKKHVTYRQTTLGRVVPLCRKCHQELFNPYTRDGRPYSGERKP